MPTPSRWIARLAPVAGAALLVGPATAQTVEQVDVGLPTSVRVSLLGKSEQQVLSDIHRGARLVCRNAVRRAEIDTSDYIGCARASASAASEQYRPAAGGEAPTRTALLVEAVRRSR